MENGTWLANFLNKQREIIEAAETPFAKLAIFILPIVAPFVPAIITGMRLYTLFLSVTENEPFSKFAAGVTAFALELFGYVGAIQFIRSIYKLIRNFRNDAQWLPVILTGGAYLFYIAAMFSINIELSNGVPNPTEVFGLLALFSIPAGMLFADHISHKVEQEEGDMLRSEKRDDALKRYKIKYGINPDVTYQQTTPVVQRNHKASDYKDYVFELLNGSFQDLLNPDGEVSLAKITAAVNKKKRVELVHSAVKGTWYKYLQEWKRGRQ